MAPIKGLQAQFHAEATQDAASRDKYWEAAANNIHWYRRWDQVVDFSRPPFAKWFVGGQTNTCFNCVDRHVAFGRGNQIALIYDSPVTKTVRKVTFLELQGLVARFAGVLRKHGVGYQDRVIVYMPNSIEAVVAMLACGRIGAIHSVVFGGFAPKELATRIADATPKVLVTASCGIEGSKVLPYLPMVKDAVERCPHKPAACIVLQRPQHRAADLQAGYHFDWEQEMATTAPVDCVPVEATDLCYILYTSGSTGVPKGVVRPVGGHMVGAYWSMANIMNVKPGDVYWAASDVGWVVGHTFIVYGPLLYGCTTVIYEGKPVGTPDAGAFWRVVSEHRVNAMFTAPTALRAIRKEDPEGARTAVYDLRRFKGLYLAGERCDPATLDWAMSTLKVPVIDNWWQTESGWPIASQCPGLEPLPVKLGSAGPPVPGYDIQVVDGDGKPVPRGKEGNIVIKLPLPPGTFPTLWQKDDHYVKSYMSVFPGYYNSGDAGMIDHDGYVHIMGRTDDIINVAGHRLSTGGMEEVIAQHPAVAESAVIAAADQLKGELPVGLVVIKDGVSTPPHQVEKELVELVREKIGAVAAFKKVVVVKRLPKTRSGKILRGVMKKIADGTPWNMPATIDDAAVLPEVTAALRTLGYAAGPKSKL